MEEDQPHIFERFYKSDKSRGLDKSGTGLGTYISMGSPFLSDPFRII